MLYTIKVEAPINKNFNSRISSLPLWMLCICIRFATSLSRKVTIGTIEQPNVVAFSRATTYGRPEKLRAGGQHTRQQCYIHLPDLLPTPSSYRGRVL